MTTVAGAVKRKVPWTGRRKVKDPKARMSTLRWTAEQYAAVSEAADKAGLTVAAFLRAVALGTPGPRSVKRAPVDKRELARLLGPTGNLVQT